MRFLRSTGNSCNPGAFVSESEGRAAVDRAVEPRLDGVLSVIGSMAPGMLRLSAGPVGERGAR
jgi:hypothetical protein